MTDTKILHEFQDWREERLLAGHTDGNDIPDFMEHLERAKQGQQLEAIRLSFDGPAADAAYRLIESPTQYEQQAHDTLLRIHRLLNPDTTKELTA